MAMAIESAFDDATVDINAHVAKPRRNAFEIELVEGDKVTSVWSGIDKGPPRKLKWVEPDVVVDKLKKLLKQA